MSADIAFSSDTWHRGNESRPGTSISPPEQARPPAAATPRIRRRNRMITSCLECRRRKLKCDKLHPCTNCSKFSRDCVFLAPALDSASQMKLTEIKEKMGSLERVLEKDVARKGAAAKTMAQSSLTLPGEAEGDANEDSTNEDERGLEPTPLAVMDAAFEDDTNDDTVDLGISMGKLRLTERIGGFFRPKMVEELTFILEDPALDHRTPAEKAAPPPRTQTGSVESFLEPGPTYISLGAGFVLGNVRPKSLIDFLPQKEGADILFSHYHKAVHPINRVLHWPSFQVRYENFWTNVLLGIEPSASVQALVFSVMFAAVASMDHVDVAATFSRPKRAVLANFQSGTEVAFSKAHFLRSTKFEVLQALVIYLLPMCRSEISRSHAVLVSAAIRLGECMGLHRDPDVTYGLSPVETHVRRLVWFQLCFLDMRCTDAQGPRPILSRESYDTKLPFNISDADLLEANPQDAEDVYTEMTYSRMFFECSEMHRTIWYDRIRLEKDLISLTAVLGKIESFRKAMATKYLPILNPEIPFHQYTQLVLEMLTLRLHVAVLHRYHNGVKTRFPDRLRQILLNSGITLSEDAVKLETLPELRSWRWYSGAYQQYHTAFLLLVEMFVYPMMKDADRIWHVLDYVYETDRSLSRAQKSRMIITELRERIAIYRDIRKMRTPLVVAERLYSGMLKSIRGVDYKTINAMRTAGDLTLPERTTRLSLEENTGSVPTPPQSRVPDPRTSPPSDTTSGSPSSDPAFHNWTFDRPATHYLSGNYTTDTAFDACGIGRRREGGTNPPVLDPASAIPRIPQPTQVQPGANGTWGYHPTPDQTQVCWTPLQPGGAPVSETRSTAQGPTNPGSAHGSNPELRMDIDWVRIDPGKNGDDNLDADPQFSRRPNGTPSSPPKSTPAS